MEHITSQLTELVFVWRLLIAAVFGAVLGLERSIAGKHAGMRTYALVALGSCLFTSLGVMASYQYIDFVGVNPLQLAGFIIVGIGFIGSGLSVFRGEHPVELTTASGIWMVAGVGIACGFGLYLTALGATVLGLLIFSLLSSVEWQISRKYGLKHEE